VVEDGGLITIYYDWGKSLLFVVYQVQLFQEKNLYQQKIDKKGV
jgi:hypothetical protein